MRQIKISVRNLIEFIMRSGDIQSSFVGSDRALEGTRLHQKIQKNSGDNYKSEVFLKYEFEYNDINFIVEGRADGIIKEENKITIDEIKTTSKDIEEINEDYNLMHWAQAKCYGYIYCKKNSLEDINVRLTYCEIDKENIKRFNKHFSIEELKQFFYDLIDKYLKWANLTYDMEEKRDNSIGKLNFPFQEYRKGQRKLAVCIYRTILDKKNIFIKAPTGIGKTISVIFPAVKSLKEGLASKIFYLTAKTITGKVAEDTLNLLIDNGLYIKAVLLTAKEKICFNDKVSCNAEECEYAKGHYDRVNEALIDILKNENFFTKDIIEKYAMKYKICPFEFSLDLTIFSSFIICDYNYVFDPKVYLKRFFDDFKEDYVFLIDEAHNLVDRSRDMFSSEIDKERFLNLKKHVKNDNSKLYKKMNKVNSIMIKLKKLCEKEEYFIQKESIKDLENSLRAFIKEMEKWLKENKNALIYDDMLKLYFDSISYIRISEFYDERYVTYIKKDNKNIIVKLFCIDPSYLLKSYIERGRTTVFFSATLNPLDYFMNILGGENEDYVLSIKSPFDKENRKVIIDSSISTRYKDRKYSYEKIANYIMEIYNCKKGNYIVFFPSYEYLNKVYEIFSNKYNDVHTICQNYNMDEEDRREFLNQFNERKEMIAFSVLGGLFSEGIDLKGDKLLGSIIIGVGLPQICIERNIIKEYFKKMNSKGYEYAYVYPGMIKVQQAAGRVIRTKQDRGIIILIDDRFNKYNYKKLFPYEWHPYINVNGVKDSINILKKFWKLEKS